MPNSLHSLFQTIAQARDERELRSQVMAAVGQHFLAQCWSLCLVDQHCGGAEVDIQGIADVAAFVERYSKVDRTRDPVMRYTIEHHAPTHEGLVLSSENWKQCDLYQQFCAPYGHEHIMTGPIVGDGRLIGGVYLARAADTAAFDMNDLAKLGAICTHLSARLAHLRVPTKKQTLAAPSLNAALTECLTPREQQIAALVAQGLTNTEIGNELWITQNSVKQALKRMFRKLGVSSRTQMVACLSDTGIRRQEAEGRRQKGAVGSG